MIGDLPTAAIGAMLTDQGWTLSSDGAKATLCLRFANFDAAWSAMERIAAAARRLDHHPDWHNVYAMLDITLTTHDAGCLTALDLALAAEVHAAAAAHGGVRDTLTLAT